MTTLIFALFLLGLALIFLEVIFLEGILGILGGIAFISAWSIVFVEYGLHWGMVSVVGGILAIVLMVVLELKLVSRTRFGQRFFHREAIEGTSQAPVASDDLVGREGEALTTLTPTGVILVDNRRYEAFSMSGRLDRGTRVRVVGYDNFRVNVKPA